MRLLFENKALVFPQVSIILLDWSCRESYHTLHYLNKQDVPRDQYEIIWIEYYNKRPVEIEAGIARSQRTAEAPIVDKWIIMEIDKKFCYHKHLMYNIGILASRGKIVALCDSDAIARSSFVGAILAVFEGEKNIVLHMDEVRNMDKRFYPFNYPTLEEITSKGCSNWGDGKTTGLLDEKDPLHSRNYGACMSAVREDLINIGGADEDRDYLGHVCGPYEMTFRLVNAGKKEVWHANEFLYHTWHPGIDGESNYQGPHDGRHISTTALDARRTRRILPLVENPAIKMRRMKQDNILYEDLMAQAIPEEEIRSWTIENRDQDDNHKSLWKLGDFKKHPIMNLWVGATLVKMLAGQFYSKMTKFSRQPKDLGDFFRKGIKAFRFLKNMDQYNKYLLERGRRCLEELVEKNVREFAVLGTGPMAEVLYKLSLASPVKIQGIYDRSEPKKFFKFYSLPLEALKEYNGKIVVASLVGTEEAVEMLQKLGLKQENILLM